MGSIPAYALRVVCPLEMGLRLARRTAGEQEESVPAGESARVQRLQSEIHGLRAAIPILSKMVEDQKQHAKPELEVDPPLARRTDVSGKHEHV